MDISRKTYLLLAGLFFLMLLSLSGCDNGGSSPTSPGTAPQLTGYTVANDQPVHAGATIVLHIDYVDTTATMNDGVAYITYSEGTYTEAVSNASGTSGTLLTSFDLSPLVSSGQLLVEVWIQNGAGNSSNTIQFLLNVA